MKLTVEFKAKKTHLHSQSFCCLPLFSHSVVSESCDPMDCSPSGSSAHGISQTRILEWVNISFSRGIFQTQGSNLPLLHCRQILYS